MYPVNSLLPFGTPAINPNAPSPYVNQYRPELDKRPTSQQAINPGPLMMMNTTNPHRK